MYYEYIRTWVRVIMVVRRRRAEVGTGGGSVIKMDDAKSGCALRALHRYGEPRWPPTPNTLLATRVGSSSFAISWLHGGSMN